MLNQLKRHANVEVAEREEVVVMATNAHYLQEGPHRGQGLGAQLGIMSSR